MVRQMLLEHSGSGSKKSGLEQSSQECPDTLSPSTSILTLSVLRRKQPFWYWMTNSMVWSLQPSKQLEQWSWTTPMERFGLLELLIKWAVAAPSLVQMDHLVIDKMKQFGKWVSLWRFVLYMISQTMKWDEPSFFWLMYIPKYGRFFFLIEHPSFQ